MRFWHELRYDAPPVEVHTMLADPAFRQKVCLANHAASATVSIEPAGEGMSVVVDQRRPSEGIPGYARKIVGDEIQILQREDWSSASDAALDVSIPGKPAQLKATIVVIGDGSGAVETIEGDLSVKIPLLGAKLESLISKLLTKAMEVEEKVGRAWLRGER